MTRSRRAPSRAAPARAAAARRALLDFAAAMTLADRARATRAVTAGRRAGARRAGFAEGAFMLVLHAGTPAALEALALLHARWPGRANGAPAPSIARRRRDGARRGRRIYGRSWKRLLENVRALHPAMPAWMVEEGYGRVLSRPGLAARERERVAVAVLAAGGWERQLVSHVLGALRFGCPERDVREAIARGVRGAGAAKREAATRAWRRARAVRDGKR